MSEKKHLFCFGYGYSCDFLGIKLQTLGNWEISGTTRDPEKRAAMREEGIRSFIFSHEQPLGDPRHFLKGVTHLLVSAPPDDEGDPVFVLHGEDIAKVPSLEWIGYLSSTSIYGDRNGAWVDESSTPDPSSRRGSRRLTAENQWMSLYKDHNLPVHIFRLAGIYGPGRSALDSVRAGGGRRIDKPGHVFSRIHVEDIVQVLLASMQAPHPGAIYNVCDDDPAPSHEVIKLACELLGFPVPPLIPFDKADLAPMARSFYADNKRLHNDRIKEELGVQLIYPSYREGLKACLAADQGDRARLEHDGPGPAAKVGTGTE